MPKSTTQPLLAHNAKRLATTHGFSKEDQDRLEKALRESAKIIAPNPIGNARNTLYVLHKDRLFSRFSTTWDFTNTTHEWTMSSIRKILSNYLFDYNKKTAAGSKAPGPKAIKASATKSDQGRSSKSGPVIKEEETDTAGAIKHTVGRHRRQPFEGTSSSFKPINTPLRSPALQFATTRSSSSDHKSSSSQSPADSAVSSDERNLDKVPSALEGVTEVAGSRTQSSVPSNGSNISKQRDSIKLSEIILVVRPSLGDPWGRKLVSFPLWRCQVPVDGRDAAPEALQDWRDLSFLDFVRQLKAEEVISTGELLVWGQFDQVVTSDMTFSGAIQEQLHEALDNGLAFNEATFMVAKSLTNRSL